MSEQAVRVTVDLWCDPEAVDLVDATGVIERFFDYAHGIERTSDVMFERLRDRDYGELPRTTCRSCGEAFGAAHTTDCPEEGTTVLAYHCAPKDDAPSETAA